MTTKKYEIQRSNLLIEADYNIPNVYAYRLALVGMSSVCTNLLNNPEDEKALTVKIKTEHLKKLFPSFKKARSSIHPRIDKATDDIGKNNTLKIQKDDGNWKKIAFIDEMEYRNFDELIIHFNKKTRQYFNTNSKFTRYLINDTARLQSYQQIRIYELCIQYIKVGARKIDIPTFKKFIGIQKNKPTSVLIQELKACIKQINQKTNIKVEFETIKTGRKITDIKFKMCRNDTHPLDEINQQHQSVSLKTQLKQLGFTAEKIEPLLKIPKEILSVVVIETQKAKGKGFKKSMEACFFWHLKHLNKDKKQIEPYKLLQLFKGNLSIKEKKLLWEEFYNQLTDEEKEAYSHENRDKNKTVKAALDQDFNNKFNRWIFETKLS